MRFVCRFSCGAASAVATKLILAEQEPVNVLIVNAFVKEEHEDNRRFLADCERWFNHPIVVVRNEEYGASTDEVWKRNKFIVSYMGAKNERMSLAELPAGRGDMKKEPNFSCSFFCQLAEQEINTV